MQLAGEIVIGVVFAMIMIPLLAILVVSCIALTKEIWDEIK